jgi:hypothetical protein
MDNDDVLLAKIAREVSNINNDLAYTNKHLKPLADLLIENGYLRNENYGLTVTGKTIKILDIHTGILES